MDQTSFWLARREVVGLLLKEMCLKLPATRSGNGLYLEAPLAVIAERMSNSLTHWFYPVYAQYFLETNPNKLSLQKFEELAGIVLEEHLLRLPMIRSGARISKTAGTLDGFLDGVLNAFDVYGFFGSFVNTKGIARIATFFSSFDRQKETTEKSEAQAS